LVTLAIKTLLEWKQQREHEGAQEQQTSIVGHSISEGS